MAPRAPKNLIWSVVLMLFCAGFALYFRTYALHHPISQRSSEEIARLMVHEKLRSEFKKKLDSRTDLSEDLRQKLADEKAGEVIKTQKDAFSEIIKNAKKNIKASAPIGSSRHYLLESDPYHYYYLTREIERTGRISKQFRGNLYYNPLRQAPFGLWSPVTAHPYLGFWWSKLFRVFSARSDLMEALCYFPLVLVVAVILIFWYTCRTFEIKELPILIGCLTLTLSPFFVQRSAFGWYDTDAYQYIFPPLVFGLAVYGLKENQKTIRCGMLGGFLTSAYSLFWLGWPFLFLLTAGSALILMFLQLVLRKNVRRSLQLFCSYVTSVLICSFFVLTPSGFLSAFLDGFHSIQEFFQSNSDIWPNVFLTVGEATPVSFKRLTEDVLPVPLIALALVGIFYLLWKAFQEKEENQFFKWIFLSGGFLVTLVMTLSTERFAILWVLFASFLCAYGAACVQSIFKFIFRKDFIIAFVMLALSLPLFLRAGEAGAESTTLIMNDTWYNALEELKEKTPADAIVDSWWPPGYFINAIAERKTIVDGGSQYFPQTFWLAKAFLANNERDTAGIFRMLNLSGNRAVDFLESKGFSAQESVDTILNIVSLDLGEAQAKPMSRLSAEERKDFLKLTHAEHLTPAYVFIYNDAIDQNLAISIMADWNFDKAKEMRAKNIAAAAGKKKSLEKILDQFLPERRFHKTVSDVFEITGGVQKYIPESLLLKTEGDTLYFSNGVAIKSDLSDALVTMPNLTGRPMSLFYLDQGELKEKIFSGPRVDVSALLINHSGRMSVVLADARLIRSTLFKLYYLDAEGLRIFKSLITKVDPLTQTVIKVFKIDWREFRDEN